MRLREIIRYEIGYRLRNKTTWVYAFFLALLGFFITNANAGGGGDTNANAPADIAAYAALFCGMFGMLVSAGLFSDAAVRDAEVEMDPLLYTTRLTTLEFLSGRYLATLAVNAVIALAIPLGLIVAFLMPYLPKDAFGPFQAAAYLQPLVLFIYPNLVLVSTIQFAIAIKTRRTLPVYLGTIAVFISYIVAANYWQHVTNPILSALTDPFGVNALQSMTRFWSRVEQETRLIGFPPMLLLNRAIWLSVAIGVLAVLHRAFRFEHEEVGGGRRRKGERPMLEMPAERQAPVAVPRVSGSFGSRTRRAQLRTVFRRAFGDVLGARGLILTLVAGLGLTLLWGWNVGDTVFDSSVWPVTHLIAEVALTDRNTMIPWLVVIVVAGELVWKDRDVGTAEMADAAPLPEWTTVLGRYLVLAALLVLLETAFLIGGVLIQTLQGYYRLELGLYVRILFGLTLPSYLIMAALAMTLHVLVNQKYVGHIVTLAAMLSVMAIPELTGMRHHLLLYNTSPGWEYSDMNGFGPFIEPYVWFKLYWAAWAALVLIVGMLFWVRGRESRVRDRLTLARFRFAGPVARAAAVAAVLALGFGGFIFYNTNVLNAYQSRDEAALPRVEYERRYGRYVDAPQPTITGAKLRVEIYPDDPAVDLSGTYTLVNRTSAPIDSVHVQLYDRNVEPRSVLLDRRATKVIDDNEVMYWIYDLEQPLAPGDSLGLTFDVTYRPKGFRNDNIPTSVVKNGAYFDRRWMPVIGYQKDLELTDADGRSRFKLPSKIWLPHPSDTVATKHRNGLRDADLVRFETTVGTSAEQTAVATGVLRRSWTENPSTGSGQAGRRYFQYDTEIPMSFGATVFSGKYERREDRWKDIALEILYHPAHAYNVDRMVESMKASLEYYTTNFGPYRGRQLRIVEVPPYDVFGRAHASAVAFGEDVLIARQKERQFDPAFYGTAHEIAHQWWGGQIGGAPVQGIAMLSESLANYSAIMVTEKTAGMAAARKVYDFQMDRYLRMRGEYSTEDPLVTVQNRPFIYYGKGAVAMYTLREQIGEEAVNRALRRYVERFAAHEPHFPTSLDLIAELRAATPDSLKYLITDLFETVTLWNVRTERARVEPTGNGDYRVTMDVVATKTRADSAGTPKEIPMNDWVEIGVFAADSANKPGDTLYLQRHRIRDGKQTITVTVARLPARAGIDPARKLMDRDKDDNVVSVEKP